MPRGRKKKSELIGDEFMSDNGIGPIDEHVGSRICARRKLLQLSQKQMADRLGITFQQIQKYEKGVNRIGSGRLYTIASILGVEIDYFFEGLSPEESALGAAYAQGLGIGFLREDDCDFKADPMLGPEAVLLLKAFYALPAKSRAALLMMLTSLKSRDDNDGDIS